MVINIRLSTIRTLLGLLCVLFVLVLSPTGAFAHANLLHSTPQPNEIVAEPPGQIALEFSEPLEIDLVRVDLYDDQGAKMPLPAPHLQAGNAARLIVTPPSLAHGSYTVIWSVVSEDGHPVEDRFVFSVGHQTTLHPPIVTSDTSVDVAKLLQNGLLITRYVTETLLLFGCGFHLMALLSERHGFPQTSTLLGRVRRPLWGVLLLVSLIEFWIYSVSVPSDGLADHWLAGALGVLQHSPFPQMLALQVVLLFLLALPNMVRSWYALIWIALAANLAFGGHAWGLQPFWLALTLRIVHLIAIAFWLGGLGYLLLAWRWERQKRADAVIMFRRLFVRTVAASSALVAVSGVFMVAVQTGWSVLLQTETLTHGNFWRTLLFSKIALLLVMLLLALVQTRRWRSETGTLSRTLLQGEVLAGLLIVEAAVWMSQIPYPHP
jgi:copper transport protein